MAVPDFSAGAMENWGLVIYRETALLFDPLVSSSSNKYMVTLIVAHEIAHTVSQRHLTSPHVTSRHGVLGWAARWPACWLLAWLWAGLVDGWFGLEEPKMMVMIAVVTRWWLACWLLAWLLASLVDGWLALRGCDLVRRAEDDGDDCSSNSMVFIVTTVATIV